MTAIRLLDVVGGSGQELRQLRKEAMVEYPQVLKNVRYRNGKPLDDPSVKSVIAAAEGKLNGQGRLLVRASGTEPVIRVMGEGDDRDLVEDIVDSICAAVGEAAAA